MKIIDTKSLKIEAVKVISFARFCDHRGYFTEHFRKSDFLNNPEMNFMKNIEFVQCNESYSKKKTVRGLHFQWNPYMGKLVRTLSGRMIDIILDIRKNSPTFGKIIMYDMPSDYTSTVHEWIWVPPGFAHGNMFTENSLIEYFCSGEYSPGYEAGISPFAPDIDWSVCNRELRQIFDNLSSSGCLITDKDKNGFSLNDWVKDERSNNFIYEKL